MDAMPTFATIEDCVAYLPTHPAPKKTSRIEFVLDDEEWAFLQGRAEQLNCTIELYVRALITMRIQDMQ
jgi:hypothetical protein